ncbi:hypothetical protein BDU57DRAFT_438041 [Ampelomyces quisqualis]|uniref:Uncharacterized protein n=1 Tax=Ampelomyces quisqualis TaxID=50730 RepID=A0A6A5R1D9_AMPQU|nr:hypothetical protein BDU57DRAFT_438041 [Ampelomyces quisqualis]
MSQPQSFPGQGYGFHDEVDWDDDDAFSMPTHNLPSNAAQSYQVRPQKTGYGSEKGYAGDQRQQHDEGRRQWEKKNRKIRQPRPPSYRDSTADGSPYKNSPYKPRSHGDRFGGPNQDLDFMSRRLQDEKHKEPFFPETVESVPTRALTTPDSVYDLRKYDAYVTDLHNDLPKHLAYRNGNGKVAPHMYGSEQGKDLGLCFVTFCTSGWCELGVSCAWRHHPLTKAEREWIHQGRERGKVFLRNLSRYWGTPEIPVPGASMHDK